MQRLEAGQHLLMDHVAQDLLSGNSYEVHRRCSFLFNKDETISKINIQDSGGRSLCSFERSQFDSVRTIRTQLFFDEQQQSVAGSFEVTYGISKIPLITTRSLILLIGVFVALVLTQMLIGYILRKNLSDPIRQLVGSFRRNHAEIGKISSPLYDHSTYLIEEISELYAGTKEMAERTNRLQDAALQVAKSEAELAIAKQVAHDIRSPLSALEVVHGSVSGLPEPVRVIIRQSIERIRDIANNLLRPKNPVYVLEEVEPLYSLVEEVVSEKRIQVQNDLKIEILSATTQLYNGFVNVNRTEFQRVVSNLVSNSIEALKGRADPKIEISIDMIPGLNATIKILDNGKGIPREVQEKLFARGFSYGKESGSGLGLVHAKETIEKLGGKVTLESEFGEGTTVAVQLPLVPCPAWHPEKLILAREMSVIIADDDPFIAPIWEDRFDKFKLKLQLKTVVLKFPAELREWVSNHPETRGNRLFLLDHEFKGSSVNGLDLMIELGIATQTVLVTSRHQDPSIRMNCLKMGAKLLSKSSVSLISIES